MDSELSVPSSDPTLNAQDSEPQKGGESSNKVKAVAAETVQGLEERLAQSEKRSVICLI